MSNLVKTQAKVPTSGVVAPPSTYFPTRPFGTEIAPTQGLGQTTQSASPASRSHSFGAVSVLPRVPLIVQPKLRLGPAKDKYEQQAEQVARQVVQQLHGPTLASDGSQSAGELVQRMSIDPIQASLGHATAAGLGIPAALEASIQQARRRGQPLPDRIRKPMGQSLGADFRGVQIHTDVRSDQLNQSIQAKAFTTGQDIFFRQGAYDPGSRAGQELIAHELTHVVQQRPHAVISAQGNHASTIAPMPADGINAIHRLMVNPAAGNVIQRVREKITVEDIKEKFKQLAMQTAKNSNSNPKQVLAPFKGGVRDKAAQFNKLFAQNSNPSKVIASPKGGVKDKVAQAQPLASDSVDLPISELVPEESGETVQTPEAQPLSNVSSTSQTPKTDRKMQIEQNLEALAELFRGGESGDEGQYDWAIQTARKNLPGFLVNRGKEKPRILSREEFTEMLDSEQPSEPEPEEQDRPKPTGRDRWNRLKKIVLTDPTLPKKSRIQGRSKTLVYRDIVKSMKPNGEYIDEPNIWLEAWDALHRPSFELSVKTRLLEEWIKQTKILDWLGDQEKRDEEMKAAFEKQKDEGGIANFWDWKATLDATPTAAPSPTLSFWEWLKQEGEGSEEKVEYLESVADRKKKEVTFSKANWTNFFGEKLDGVYIFVLSPDGKFYAYKPIQGKQHHSSALAGVPIKGAGAITVQDGKLIEINDTSGHYNPSVHQMFTILTQLEKQGVKPETYKVGTYFDKNATLTGEEWVQKYFQSKVYEDDLALRKEQASITKKGIKKKLGL